jgi:N-glycosylase/DNA lyase
VDVRIARAMRDIYGVTGSYKKVSEHARRHFGRYAGYAQEYLYIAEDRERKKEWAANTGCIPGTRSRGP